MTGRYRALAAALLLGAALAPATAADADAQTSAQPGLPVAPLTIVTGRGRFDFEVEVADDPQEQAVGLMFRETMGPRAGMLFDFGVTRDVSMWMRNTPLSLDMVFIRKDGTVASVAQRTTPFSEAIIASGAPVAYVLELNAGIANLIGLAAGDRVTSPAIGG